MKELSILIRSLTLNIFPYIFATFLFSIVVFPLVSKFFTHTGNSNIIVVGLSGVISVFTALVLTVRLVDGYSVYTHNFTIVSISILLVIWVMITNVFAQIPWFGFTFEPTTLIAIVSYIIICLVGYFFVHLNNKSNSLFLLGFNLALFIAVVVHIVYAILSFHGIVAVVFIGPDQIFSFMLLLGVGVITSSHLVVLATTNNNIRKILLGLIFLYGSVLLFSGSNILLFITGILSTILSIKPLFAVPGDIKHKYILGLLIGIVSILTIAGIFGGGAWVQSRLQVIPTHIQLPVSLTIETGLSSMQESNSYITGTGANSFFFVWNNFMPDTVVNTKLWDTDFTSGFSTMSTFMIEFGFPMLIGLNVLMLFVAFSWLPNLKHFTHLHASLLFSLFWMWVYTPSVIFLVITALFTGLILGENRKNKNSVQFSLRKSYFLGIVIILFLFIFGIFMLSSAVNHGRAVHFYYKGSKVLLVDKNNYEEAASLFLKSTEYVEKSVVFNMLAQSKIQLAKYLYTRNNTLPKAENKSLEIILSEIYLAVNYANRAKLLDIYNYHWYIVHGETLLLSDFMSKKPLNQIDQIFTDYFLANKYAKRRVRPVMNYIQTLNALDLNEMKKVKLDSLLEKYPNFKPVLELEK